MAAYTRSVLASLGLSVALNPFFFVIYRLAAFNTVPRDDYAPYLLWLTGTPGGVVLPSPYTYRLGAVALAWPFFKLLPTLQLTNIPPTLTNEWLRATAAFSALTYLCMIVSMVIAYRLARDTAVGVVAAFLLFVLFWFTQITAIDALGLLLILVAVAVLDRPVAFSLVVLASLFIDEKVVIVLVLWLTARLVFLPNGRRPWNWAASVAGLMLYLGVVHILKVPGNEYQTTLSTYPQTIHENLLMLLTAKGLFLNTIPVLLMIGIAIMAVRSGLSSPVDLLVIPGLFMTALTLTHLLQTGRIVMHAAPIFVVPAASMMYRMLVASRVESRPV